MACGRRFPVGLDVLWAVGYGEMGRLVDVMSLPAGRGPPPGASAGRGEIGAPTGALYGVLSEYGAE